MRKAKQPDPPSSSVFVGLRGLLRVLILLPEAGSGREVGTTYSSKEVG